MEKNEILEIVLELYDLYIYPEELTNELKERLASAKQFNKTGERYLESLKKKFCPVCFSRNLEFDELYNPFENIRWHGAECHDCNSEFEISEYEEQKRIIQGW